jgi:hypothetical protein
MSQAYHHCSRFGAGITRGLLPWDCSDQPEILTSDKGTQIPEFNKAVVLFCRSGRSCGVWGDRLQGITCNPAREDYFPFWVTNLPEWQLQHCLRKHMFNVEWIGLERFMPAS